MFATKPPAVPVTPAPVDYDTLKRDSLVSVQWLKVATAQGAHYSVRAWAAAATDKARAAGDDWAEAKLVAEPRSDTDTLTIKYTNAARVAGTQVDVVPRHYVRDHTRGAIAGWPHNCLNGCAREKPCCAGLLPLLHAKPQVLFNHPIFRGANK